MNIYQHAKQNFPYNSTKSIINSNGIAYLILSPVTQTDRTAVSEYNAATISSIVLEFSWLSLLSI
jgi:hypothetical protein